jgi:hypothetical protein
MKSLRKYLLSAFAAIALSLTLASVTAQAWCEPEDNTDQYYCENTGEDSCYCYYNCTCKVGQDACDLALFRNGYSKVPDMQ